MGMILGILGTIFLGLLLRWLSVEIGVWHKPLCCWLVKIATKQLPECERAAILSEWLAIIEDLRSPTAQLLNSFSFVLSAYRIRQGLDPDDARASAYAKSILFPACAIAGVGGLLAGLATKTLYFNKAIEETLASLRTPTTTLIILGWTLAMFYLSYRLLKWSYKRRIQKRTPIVERCD